MDLPELGGPIIDAARNFYSFNSTDGYYANFFKSIESVTLSDNDYDWFYYSDNVYNVDGVS